MFSLVTKNLRTFLENIQHIYLRNRNRLVDCHLLTEVYKKKTEGKKVIFSLKCTKPSVAKDLSFSVSMPAVNKVSSVAVSCQPFIQGEKKPVNTEASACILGRAVGAWGTLPCQTGFALTGQAQEVSCSLNTHSGGWRKEQRKDPEESSQSIGFSLKAFTRRIDFKKDISEQLTGNFCQIWLD